MDVFEIAKAWRKSYFHNDNEEKMANERLKICNSCEFIKETVVGHICGKCLCPINKKVYSPDFNKCPEKKWKDVDSEFFIGKKKDTTLL
jgi:hypothetical protein